MNRKFWKPSLTSQYSICPIPFHYDLYRGCHFNCNYCFARDFVVFSRRKRGLPFTHLEGNRPELFEKWVERTMGKDFYDYSRGEEVAFKERIPLKIGATSDPCPPVELKEKITYQTLKILDSYDYPVEIQTKNPGVLAEIAKDFDNPNWIVAVTLISTDEKFIKACEPSAPSAKQRLTSIEKLANRSIKTIVKCQPSIYPKIMEDLYELVRNMANVGVWAMNTEGLKIRKTMPQKERDLFNVISGYVGYDIIEYYKNQCQACSSDYELNHDEKMEYTLAALELCFQRGIRYYTADNYMGKIGCGSECCGTEALRDYKIWGNNFRTRYFDKPTNKSRELGKCKINFTRSAVNLNKTLDEVMECSFKKAMAKTRQQSLFN
jgi:DNA repair photolyase